MSKNNELVTKIKDPNFWDGKNDSEQNALLECILRAGNHESILKCLGEVTEEKENSASVLCDEDMYAIKSQALSRWIINAADKIDLDALNELNEACANVYYGKISNTRFQAVLEEKLKDFPKENKDLTQDISVDDITTSIKKKIQSRKEETAFSDYRGYIANMSEHEVLSATDLLVGDEAVFRTRVPNEQSIYKDFLTTENIVVLKEQLEKRYLDLVVNEYVKDKGSYDFSSAFRTGTLDEFKTELKCMFPEHTYIDKVVTQELMVNYKKMMASREVFKQIQTLKSDMQHYDFLMSIDKASNEKIKEILKKAPFNINEEVLAPLIAVDIDEIRQISRLRMFEMYVEYFSSLPRGKHTDLLKVFGEMNQKAQRNILTNPNEIKHIVNARDISVLKHYMPGVDEINLGTILANVAQNDVVKQIQNPVIASVFLSNTIPFVSLTVEQVAAINKKLAGNNDYVQLIDEISRICDIEEAQKASFYKAFQLTAAGDIDPDNRGKVDDVLKHNEHYQQLFNEYQKDDSTINKRLLEVILCLDSRYGQFPGDPEQFKATVHDQLFQYPDCQRFINRCIDISTVEEVHQGKFRKALARGFTPAVFNEVQRELVYQALTEQTPDTGEEAKKAITHVQETLDKVQHAHAKIAKHIEKAKFVFHVKELHINTPLFRDKNKGSTEQEIMKARYLVLVKDCDLMMDQLRHDHVLLQGYINKIPDTLGNVEAQWQVGVQAQQLKETLAVQKQQIEQKLEQYAEIKNKIEGSNGIIKMIDAVNSKSYFYYQRAEIVSKPMKRSELGEQVIHNATSDNSKITALDHSSSDEIARFMLGQGLKQDEVHCFDVLYERPQKADPDKAVTIEGRFTYDINQADATTSQGRRVSKTDSGRIEIHKFPTYKEGSPKDAAELERAKVDFAMIVATQLLATMDRSPSKEHPIRLRGMKEEELRYIWTALVILGQKTPQMKFGTDAIRVVNSHIFNPEREMGWFGFSENSTYNKVFKQHMDSVTDAINASKEQASVRFDKKAMNKSSVDLKNTNFYRKSLNNTIEEAKSRIEEQGVSPELKDEPTRTFGK